MTYRGPDPERAMERAEQERAVREAAELDEAAALRAIKKPGPALILVRVAASIVTVAASTIGSSVVGALVGNGLWGSAWGAVTGLVLGFGVGLAVGLAVVAFAVARWAR